MKTPPIKNRAELAAWLVIYIALGSWAFTLIHGFWPS